MYVSIHRFPLFAWIAPTSVLNTHSIEAHPREKGLRSLVYILPLPSSHHVLAVTAAGWQDCRNRRPSSFLLQLHSSSLYRLQWFIRNQYPNESWRKCTYNIFTLHYLTPNDDYSGRTAPLTSKRCILYIYSTNTVLNILNMLYTLRFFLFKMQFVS